MQTYLISYDITENNPRVKASRLLLRAGCFRVQKSVFIGTLSDARYLRLHKDLSSLQQRPKWSATDQVLLLPLHQYTRDHLNTIGSARDDWPLIFQELHTLVI